MSLPTFQELMEETKCLACGGMSVDTRVIVGLLNRMTGSGIHVTIADIEDVATQTTLALVLAELQRAKTYQAEVEFERPANGTPYNAGDAVGVTAGGAAGSAILEFTNIGPAGGIVRITQSKLRIDVASVPAGMTSFSLKLYDASPDAILDNAPWDLSSAGDKGKYLGAITLGNPVDLGSTLYVEVPQSLEVKLAAASTSLFGIIVTAGAYTPSSGAVKNVTLLTAE